MGPVAGGDQHEPDRDLDRHERNRRPKIEPHQGEYPWADQAGNRGDCTNGGHDCQYDTVPIVEQHGGYGRRASGRWSHMRMAQDI